MKAPTTLDDLHKSWKAARKPVHPTPPRWHVQRIDVPGVQPHLAVHESGGSLPLAVIGTGVVRADGTKIIHDDDMRQATAVLMASASDLRRAVTAYLDALFAEIASDDRDGIQRGVRALIAAVGKANGHDSELVVRDKLPPGMGGLNG